MSLKISFMILFKDNVQATHLPASWSRLDRRFKKPTFFASMIITIIHFQ